MATTNTTAPWFPESAMPGLRDYFRVYREQQEAMNAALMPVILEHPTFGPVIRGIPKELLDAQNQESLERTRRAIEEGAWGPYEERLRADGVMYARMGVTFRDWYDIIGMVNRELVPRLVNALGDDPARLIGALRAMQDLMDRAMTIIGEGYIETKEKALREEERERAEALRESEARRAEAEAMRRSKDAAEEANAELEAFSYSIAHDLRAPLRGISGFSAALLEDFRDKIDAEGTGYLRRIIASAEQMGKTIDALLGLSRLTRTELRREALDMTTIAQQVALSLRAGDPGREVDFAIKGGMTVLGDAQLVRALLENLLGNAWKFTGKQGRARIEFGAVEMDGEHVWFVRDNGAGFDMAYADKLFAPFKRLHSPREFPGTGIGLATVQRIVRRHGGRIWAEGVVGEGATFRFTLAEAPVGGDGS